MISRELQERLFDADVRIEKIAYVGTEWVDSPTEIIQDFFDDGCYDSKDFFVGRDNYLLKDADAMDDASYALECFIENEHENAGFIVMFACQVPINPTFNEKGEATSWRQSWGCYWTRCYYGSDLTQVFEAGIKWAEKQRAGEFERVKKEVLGELE